MPECLVLAIACRPGQRRSHGSSFRLFGDACQWSIVAAGRDQMIICTMGAIMGGNMRVGLEEALLEP